MRTIALFLALWAWVPFGWQPLRGQTPGVGKDASKKKPNNSAGTDSATQPSGTNENPLVVDTTGHQQTPVEREEAQKQAAKAAAEEQYHRGVDRWMLRWTGVAAIATALLVLVGMGGTIAAVCSLRAIRRQTASLEKQVGAIITAERPWLLMEKTEEPYLVPPSVGGNDNRLAYCFSKQRNHGKTPARIIAARAWLDTSTNPSVCPINLTEEIDRARQQPDPSPYVFAPQQSETYETQYKGGQFISVAERDAILTHHTQFLWFCGFMLYQDTFDPSRSLYESVFCYVYETRLNSPKPEWRPSGPVEYNRET